jgi:dTDP-4-dehydrorhamnose reductase
MRLIILTGREGKLGSVIKLKHPEVKSFTKKTLDITDRPNVFKTITEEKPKYIINCAALTDSEYCEAHPTECWNVNVIGVRNLAEAANMVKAKLIHFSSNYVINPVNEYGWSKLASESIAAQNGLVLRTDMYDISTFIINKLFFTNEIVNAYNDRFFNPISIYSFVKILFNMLDKTGIYNIGTKKRLSMYEFALKICKVFNLDINRVIPLHSNEKQEKVKRPKELYLKPYNNLSILDDLRLFKNELKR